MFKNLKNLNHHFIRPTGATESYREFIKFREDCGIFWSFPSEQRIQRRDKKTLWDPPLTPMSSMQLTRRQESIFFVSSPLDLNAPYPHHSTSSYQFTRSHRPSLHKYSTSPLLFLKHSTISQTLDQTLLAHTPCPFDHPSITRL